MAMYSAALRTSAAAIILAGSLVARAAVPAQTADLQLTGELAPVSGAAPTKLNFGKTIDYTFTLVNNGPGFATGVAITAWTLPAGTKVAAVSGATCGADADGNPVLPCAVAADLLPVDPSNSTDPNRLTLGITLSLDVPAATPAACPAPAPLGDLTVTVSTDANTTETDPANNTATVAGAGVTVQPYTDLGVAFVGPTDSAVGKSVTFTGTVTNAGPCPAENVVVSFFPGNLLTFQSGTGACTTTDDCQLGTVAPGATVTFASTYKIAPLPSDVIQTEIPYELDLATDTNNVNADGGVATTYNGPGGIRVGKEAGGCSSGGPGGLLAVALMAAAVFAARRRRTA